MSGTVYTDKQDGTEDAPTEDGCEADRRAADMDPKGLVRESFRIPGITAEECRSIFLDWALSLPEGADAAASARALLASWSPGNEGHPMLAVLGEGAAATSGPPVRRGGSRARPRE